PTFWSPTAFNIPEGVGYRRGGGAPSMGSRERPLVTKPPRRFRLTRWANSRPYPKVPLAARIGFRRRNAPICTLRSTARAEVTSWKRITRSLRKPTQILAWHKFGFLHYRRDFSL